MEYEKAKYEVSQLGAKFLTEDEMTVILKGRYNLYIPFGCEYCGEARSKHDFTDILYFEAKSKQLFEWAQEHGGGLASTIVNYGMIARCKFCGHSDIFSGISYQAVLERLSKLPSPSKSNERGTKGVSNGVSHNRRHGDREAYGGGGGLA